MPTIYPGTASPAPNAESRDDARHESLPGPHTGIDPDALAIAAMEDYKNAVDYVMGQQGPLQKNDPKLFGIPKERPAAAKKPPLGFIPLDNR